MEEHSLLCNHHCAISNLYVLILYRSAYEKLWFSLLLYSPVLLLLNIRTEEKMDRPKVTHTERDEEYTNIGWFSPLLHEVKYLKIHNNSVFVF